MKKKENKGIYKTIHAFTKRIEDKTSNDDNNNNSNK